MKEVNVGKIIWTAMQALVGLLVTISLLYTQNMSNNLNGLLQDVAVMKGNRFTSADGLLVWKEISKIQADLVNIKSKVAELPPSWLRERIDKLEDRIDKRLDAIEKQITVIQERQRKLSGAASLELVAQDY